MADPWLLGSKGGPTPAPSPYPWSEQEREVQMIVAECLSVFLRVVIGIICVARLRHYHCTRVLHAGDVKTVFHWIMLATVFLNLPYFSFCLAHYDIWQCSAMAEEDGHGVYRADWVLYSFLRVGVCLQVSCLSITLITWSDFLRFGRYISDLFVPSRGDKPSYWLRLSLLLVNSTLLIFTLAVSALMSASSSRGKTRNSDFAMVDWIALGVVQLLLVGLFLFCGCRLFRRLRATVVFDENKRRGMLLRLNIVLGLITVCIICELFTRAILSMPLYMPGWESRPHPDVYIALQRQPVLLQILAYVIPYDVQSLCLLYLMRAPPKPPAALPGGWPQHHHQQQQQPTSLLRPYHDLHSSITSSSLSQKFLGSEIGQSLPTMWGDEMESEDLSMSRPQSLDYFYSSDEGEGGGGGMAVAGARYFQGQGEHQHHEEEEEEEEGLQSSLLVA
eukprot:CAMPEP_0118976402 /NCGR_PEP_ID=MMETSP1173-20130426/18721_1 /TAXON_ID=1034831 /ORGANISM="Rhizochromulina marina cf, Strain CCMP1243" /LENGTH=445 /DNA_ID=CAMNT_0006926429 /DNA_START=139 /DNA_END=1473 /DNA_ORIENTATION=+